jgi:hypothetical protein
MPEFNCPECNAAIEPDLVETTGRAECPFCAADLSSLGLPVAADRPRDRGADFIATSESVGVVRELPALPAKSQIQVVESTDERMVFYIPGGGKSAAGIGCFALLWNGFMGVFTIFMSVGLIQGKQADAPPLLAMLAFIGLFWAVGLGMAYFWIRMKYERTFLLVERERIVVQKILFNRKRVDESPLGPKSRAELVEAYSQNDSPVYRIEIQGATRAAKFGTALADKEKEWLADRINDFLSPDSSANAPAERTDNLQSGMASLTVNAEGLPSAASNGESAEIQTARLDSRDLPPDSPIQVEEDSLERLRFRMPAAQYVVMRWIVGIFCLVFGTFWYGALINGLNFGRNAAGGFPQVIFAIFLIPFFIGGLIPVGMGLMSFFGRITVDITRDKLTCRWSVGKFGWTKSFPTIAITRVAVDDGSRTRGGARIRRHHKNTQNSCNVWAGEKFISLTMLFDDRLNHQVAALVRKKLLDLGCHLSEF